jgi:hypothetical protein
MKLLVAVALFALGALAYLGAHRSASPPAKPQAHQGASVAVKKKPKQVSLVWAGDLTPGSRYGLPGGNGQEQLGQVRSYLRKADITAVNLEGTLTDGGSDKCGASPGGNCFSFAAPPRFAKGLAWAGVDVANLANNHSMDSGQQGLMDTKAALEARGIQTAGLPGQTTYMWARGIKVAILGFAPYQWSGDLRDESLARRRIKAAKADVVWVVIHAGAEGSDKGSTPKGREIAFGEDRGNTRSFAHMAVKAGEDLVTGSGPHVVRGMEIYQGKLIAYSTGNFAGWRNFQLGGALSESAILTVTVAASGRMIKANWRSMLLTGPGIPSPDPSAQSAARANQLSKQDFGSRAALIHSAGRIGLSR